MFRHRFYPEEVRIALWATILLNLLGCAMLDGGVCGCIILIGSLAYWIGAIRPLVSKQLNLSDRKYLANGWIMTIGLSVIISPIVWNLRGRF